MIPSIRGGWLPESAEDYARMQLRRYTGCHICEAGFSEKNTRTPEGWRETQLSGTCENCFNALFSEAQESGVDEL